MRHAPTPVPPVRFVTGAWRGFEDSIIVRGVTMATCAINARGCEGHGDRRRACSPTAAAAAERGGGRHRATHAPGAAIDTALGPAIIRIVIRSLPTRFL